MREAFSFVRQNNKTSFDRNKRIYDARVKEMQFSPGDLVWFYKPRFRTRLSRKWQCLTTGPVVVVRRVNLANYVLQRSLKSKPFITNVDRMRPYEGSIPETLKTLINSLKGHATDVDKSSSTVESNNH